MRLELKVIGERLFDTVLGNFSTLAETFLQLCCDTDPIDAVVTRFEEKPQVKDFLLETGRASVILVEASDLTLIESLQSMERKELAFLNQAGSATRLAPLIAVFESAQLLSEIRELPDLISDWTFFPLEPLELSRRIFSVLKRKNIVKTKVLYGALSLLSESRALLFFGNAVHLTRSEFALMELFLTQMGTVIPLADLALLFRSTGKSTEGSNIRVTIFQLRLKLEMLTKGQYTVTSVYRQGYCLKQKSRSTIKEISDGLDARQRVATRLLG
ncbi:winged helix-turn-helix domain-containing protein|uniref:winged helix-turn-helix domain-containing protein n=1 Tax=Noviherbaspirillum sp. L7-7A TaxID=2850560 RepID=UPI001C2C60E4|nr:winged helix-turn-helix domain-containing protein [Noviherbaspirillum sp. L7-7A]MBV0878960.1 winged helix-turn-helix domain-containing protein [Noviherbaspirillum sp. L7-7A]